MGPNVVADSGSTCLLFPLPSQVRKTFVCAHSLFLSSPHTWEARGESLGLPWAGTARIAMRIQQSKGLCSFLSEPAAFQLAVGILGCPCSSQVALLVVQAAQGSLSEGSSG